MTTDGARQPDSKRAEAIELADEALALLERTDGSLVPTLLRVMRIARLVGNAMVEQWMRLELRGYRGNALDAGGFLPSASWSGREGLVDADGNQRYYVASLEEIEAELEITRGEIAASATPVGSLQEHGAANYLGQTATERIVATASTRRTLAAAELRKWTRIVATVRGSLHDWLSLQIVELRYGVVLETAFDRARARVDGYLARYAPEVAARLRPP